MPIDRLPAELAETHEVVGRGPITLLLRRDWKDALPVEAMLDGATLTDWGGPVEHGLVGRGAVHVLATPRGEIVAKAYSRGGVIGVLLRHWYMDSERPLREAAVVEELMRRGCPTPPVVAARATRGPTGMYRLEIATARVDGARDLLDVLREALSGARPDAGDSADPQLERLATDAGRTLRTLHDVGLHHRDMQVKNLLVPATHADAAASNGAPLIVLDLDRCEIAEPPAHAERVQSLARFGRSLVKNRILPGLSKADHRGAGLPRAVRAFVSAYGALPEAGRGVLLAEVRARLRKSLRTHELLWDDPAATERNG